MVTIEVSAADFQANSAEYLRRVKEDDVRVFVVSNGDRIVELRRPAAKPSTMSGRQLAARIRDLPRLPLDEALAFADDIEAAQRAANEDWPGSNWQS